MLFLVRVNAVIILRNNIFFKGFFASQLPNCHIELTHIGIHKNNGLGFEVLEIFSRAKKQINEE